MTSRSRLANVQGKANVHTNSIAITQPRTCRVTPRQPEVNININFNMIASNAQLFLQNTQQFPNSQQHINTLEFPDIQSNTQHTSTSQRPPRVQELPDIQPIIQNTPPTSQRYPSVLELEPPESQSNTQRLPTNQRHTNDRRPPRTANVQVPQKELQKQQQQKVEKEIEKQNKGEKRKEEEKQQTKNATNSIPANSDQQLLEHQRRSSNQSSSTIKQFPSSTHVEIPQPVVQHQKRQQQLRPQFRPQPQKELVNQTGSPRAQSSTVTFTQLIIYKAFHELDKELGKQHVAKTPVRMVLLGDALSMWKYEYRKSISTVDVFLDPCLNTEHRETSLRCADQVAMALRLPQEWMSDCNKKDFTQEALVNAFKRSVGHVEVPRLYDGAHLEVYAMDSRVAFEMKLRQIQNPDRDTNMDVSEATKLLYEATGGGQQPLSFYRCQKPQYSGGKIDIPDFVVGKVKERFEQLYNKKHGIVYTEYDKTTKRWLYKNMKDDEWRLLPEECCLPNTDNSLPT